VTPHLGLVAALPYQLGFEDSAGASAMRSSSCNISPPARCVSTTCCRAVCN
jgi:hypothetical protein